MFPNFLWAPRIANFPKPTQICMPQANGTERVVEEIREPIVIASLEDPVGWCFRDPTFQIIECVRGGRAHV